MHCNIIILSTKELSYNGTYLLNTKVKLLDDCHLQINEDIITFDYLIITDITLVEGYKEIGILTESKIPVTNYDKQTSVENIYYCKEQDINDILTYL